jgi:hypothetical protein
MDRFPKARESDRAKNTSDRAKDDRCTRRRMLLSSTQLLQRSAPGDHLVQHVFYELLATNDPTVPLAA